MGCATCIQEVVGSNLAGECLMPSYNAFKAEFFFKNVHAKRMIFEKNLFTSKQDLSIHVCRIISKAPNHLLYMAMWQAWLYVHVITGSNLVAKAIKRL